MSYSKIILIGNLGRNPEIRYTPNGNAVCDFSLAINTKDDKTDWWKVTVWGKSAEAASKYLCKGAECYVEGRPATEQWTDRDGKERFTLICNATDVQFLNSKLGKGGEDESTVGMPREKSFAPVDDGDRIPF